MPRRRRRPTESGFYDGAEWLVRVRRNPYTAYALPRPPDAKPRSPLHWKVRVGLSVGGGSRDGGRLREIDLKALPRLHQMLARFNWGIYYDAYACQVVAKPLYQVLNAAEMQSRNLARSHFQEVKQQLAGRRAQWETARSKRMMMLTPALLEGYIDAARNWPGVFGVAYNSPLVSGKVVIEPTAPNSVLIGFYPTFYRHSRVYGLTTPMVYEIAAGGLVTVRDARFHPHIYPDGRVCSGTANFGSSMFYSLQQLPSWHVGTDLHPANGSWAEWARTWWCTEGTGWLELQEEPQFMLAPLRINDSEAHAKVLPLTPRVLELLLKPPVVFTCASCRSTTRSQRTLRRCDHAPDECDAPEALRCPACHDGHIRAAAARPARDYYTRMSPGLVTCLHRRGITATPVCARPAVWQLRGNLNLLNYAPAALCEEHYQACRSAGAAMTSAGTAQPYLPYRSAHFRDLTAAEHRAFYHCEAPPHCLEPAVVTHRGAVAGVPRTTVLMVPSFLCQRHIDNLRGREAAALHQAMTLAAPEPPVLHLDSTGPMAEEEPIPEPAL